MADDIAAAILKRKGVPNTKDNMSAIMQYIAQHPQEAEALSMGLRGPAGGENQQMFPALDLTGEGSRLPPESIAASAAGDVTMPPPSVTRPQRSASGVSSSRGNVPKGAGGVSPNVEPPSGSMPSTTSPTSPGGDDGGSIWPWLVPLLGLLGGGKRAGSQMGSKVGSTLEATPHRPPVAGALTDQTTRVMPSETGTDMQLEGPPPREAIGYDKTPRPQYKGYPIPTDAGAAPPQVGGPRAMSMFSDRFTPEAGDELARTIQLMAEGGGMPPQVRDALFGLSNLIAAGPAEGALDQSREAIAALQSLPYSRQVQIMNAVRGNPILSQDFNAYLQPKLGRSGDILKKTMKRSK